MEEMPLFVKLDNYEKSLKLISKSKDGLNQVKDLLSRLESLRSKEQAEMKQLEEEIAIVESRLLDLHNSLKKPREEQ